MCSTLPFGDLKIRRIIRLRLTCAGAGSKRCTHLPHVYSPFSTGVSSTMEFSACVLMSKLAYVLSELFCADDAAGLGGDGWCHRPPRLGPFKGIFNRPFLRRPLTCTAGPIF